LPFFSGKKNFHEKCAILRFLRRAKVAYAWNRSR